LRQKRRLETDFGADPFSFSVWGIGRVVATAATAELWPEIRRLNLVEVADFSPGFVADSSRDIDFELQN